MDVCIGTDQCRNHNSTINFVMYTKFSEMIPVFCVFRNYLHKRIIYIPLQVLKDPRQ